jgi:cob(I)alamin adenosyltransferase
MSISTKTGDDGTTSLRTGERVSKAHAQIAFHGTLDELNAHIGVLLSFPQWPAKHPLPEFKIDSKFTGTGDLENKKHFTQILQQIQNDLLTIGSGQTPDLPALESAFTQLEQEITTTLPPLTNFILPGGHPIAAQAHLARTVCRRAERELVALLENRANPDSHRADENHKLTLPYLNRLSDFLFLLARKINYASQTPEDHWKSSAK